MPKKPLAIGHPERAADLKVAEAILGLIAQVPNKPKSPNPGTRARAIASRAAMKAALTAGSLALPPGTLAGSQCFLILASGGLETSGSDGCRYRRDYGKNAYLTREQMIYCLFRHTAAQAVRDLVVRVGERILVQGVSLGAMQGIAREVGISITRRAIRKGVSRWLPVIGAVGVGTYAYFDTGQVARTAIELFEREITLDCSSPHRF